MLVKLTAQDQIAIEKEELDEKYRQLEEEYQNSQKALDYYQNDMIPSIKTNTDKL